MLHEETSQSKKLLHNYLKVFIKYPIITETVWLTENGDIIPDEKIIWKLAKELEKEVLVPSNLTFKIYKEAGNYNSIRKKMIIDKFRDMEKWKTILPEISFATLEENIYTQLFLHDKYVGIVEPLKTESLNELTKINDKFKEIRDKSKPVEIGGKKDWTKHDNLIKLPITFMLDYLTNRKILKKKSDFNPFTKRHHLSYTYTPEAYQVLINEVTDFEKTFAIDDLDEKKYKAMAIRIYFNDIDLNYFWKV
jgi:hypothetical protein